MTGYTNATVICAGDVDLGSLHEGERAITAWTPIGTVDHPFIGSVAGGIINGTGTGLEPQSNATRAQVAQILMNFDQEN